MTDSRKVSVAALERCIASARAEFCETDPTCEADFYCKACGRLETRCECPDIALAAMPALLDAVKAAKAAEAARVAYDEFDQSVERPDGWAERCIKLVEDLMETRVALRAALSPFDFEERT